MKPKKIILVRHCESVGNVDSSAYENTPDWKIPLTQKGKEQAEEVSKKLFKRLKIDDSIFLQDRFPYTYPSRICSVYCSPWYRTRQTASPFLKNLEVFCDKRIHPDIYSYKEDPRLREQEWGNYKEEPWYDKIGRERSKFGTFFYRIPFGESGADVFDRVSTFNETLHRDFKNTNFPDNVVIFSHGLTIRIFLMRWFHWTVEEFQNTRNPYNGQIIEMARDSLTDKYVLKTSLRKRDPSFKQDKPWDV